MIGLTGIIRSITAIIVVFVMHTGMIQAVNETPDQAAEEFMKGLTQGQTEIMNMYMDNEYINFINNVDGSEETVSKLRKALLDNLSYEIKDMREKGSLAVVKVKIKGNDFSDAMEEYEKASYDYVTENLYDDSVIDKEALKKKCLDIYVDQIESEAKDGELKETTVFLPMTRDENRIWSIILTDEIMKQLLGNIALPEGVIEEKKQE